MFKHTVALLIVVASAVFARAQDGAGAVDKVKFAQRTAAKAAELLRSDKANQEVVTGLVQLVISRQPNDNEKKIMTEFLNKKNREDAGRDIIWALMNSMEFMKLMNFTDLKEVEEINTMLIKSWPKK